MRAGRLDTPATVLKLGADLSVQELPWLWVGIATKESADVPAQAGLRSSAKVEVRAWYDESLVQGNYLRTDDRLLHITSVRDFKGDRSEVVMTCEDLIGQPAEYYPDGGAMRACRAHMIYEAPHRDEFGQATEYLTRAEVALVEVGRVQAGDGLKVGAVMYVVAEYADASDDGVVRGLWLRPVE